MIVTNTAADGLVIGIKKTFDGEHPCAMCCKIAEARQKAPAPDPISELLGKQGSAKHFILSSTLPDLKVFVCEITTKNLLAPPQCVGLGAEPPVLPPPRTLA